MRVLILLLGLASVASAQVSVTFYGGLATPGEAVNDVYNRSELRNGDTLRSIVRDAVRMGYQLGIRTLTAVHPNVQLGGGIALVRFPQSRLYITDPQRGDTVLVLASVQNMVPISAGITVSATLSQLRLYALAELAYTLVNSSTDVEQGVLSFPLALGSQSDHRVGAGIGAGIQLWLGILGIGVEGRYSIANLIGRTSGEQRKDYVSAVLLLSFGG
ncbi:MAG: hypothetical protein RRA60_00375 [Chlorobiota bacterium]|jgi:hypothetical protein|nr:hypothetical protein [Chlorobiota bacterium]